MERQFYNEDFERFLRDNANQYRMYPSEKVWKGVYTALHTRRRWYLVSALVLLLTTGSLISLFVINSLPDKAEIIAKNLSWATLENKISATTGMPRDNELSVNRVLTDYQPIAPAESPIALQKYRVAEPAISPIAKLSFSLDLIFPERIFNTGKETTAAIVDANIEQNDITETTSTRINLPINTLSPGNSIIPNNTIADNKSADKIAEATMALASMQAPIQTTKKFPRMTAQVYFTPTISYRKLSENKSYSRSSMGQSQPFNYNQFVDINKKVKHKPAMGVEVGLESRYSLNNKVLAKAGLQFNISRYDIGAYFHPTEFTTIAMNAGYGADTISVLSNYGNSSSYTPNWIENFYFQVSMPIGAEFILHDNKKTQWGVAGSVQPTYHLGERAYLLTSDYKNYVKVPKLMRSWNVNAGVETFVSYSTGRIKWQVGPQVRYQLLSSFVREYPVKENLFDIGLKIGAKINKQ